MTLERVEREMETEKKKMKHDEEETQWLSEKGRMTILQHCQQ